MEEKGHKVVEQDLDGRQRVKEMEGIWNNGIRGKRIIWNNRIESEQSEG